MTYLMEMYIEGKIIEQMFSDVDEAEFSELMRVVPCFNMSMDGI